MSEELAGQALHDRAAELEIEGRSSMTADELREAVAKAEKAQARAEAREAKAAEKAAEEAAAGKWAPGDQTPFTPPIPQTGEGDMSVSPQPDNAPSVPNVELPASVHKNSGGLVGPRERIG